MAEVRQGRLLVGRFEAVRAVTKKDGSKVPGMFEVQVVEERGDREVTHRASYFATDLEGDTSRITRDLDELAPVKGEWVAVKIVSKGSVRGGKAYSNDTATRVWSL